MSCSKCEHIKQGCDETCHCCPRCYLKGKDNECSKICEHAKHEDDGGFLIDGNHPDDMYSVQVKI
jgi:hypothetical protein